MILYRQPVSCSPVCKYRNDVPVTAFLRYYSLTVQKGYFLEIPNKILLIQNTSFSSYCFT